MRACTLLTAAVLLTGCTGGPAAPDAQGRPETSAEQSSAARVLEEIDGVRVFDRGLVPWEDGVVLDDPHVLRVMAVGLAGPPTSCHHGVVVRPVRQSETEVVLEARRFERANKPTESICPRIAYGHQAHEVRLDEPLDGRPVIEASTGKPREVIAFDDYPNIQNVPAGYQWRPPAWDDERRVVARSWGSKQGSLTLEVGPGSELDPLPAVLKHGRVNGQPVTVTRVIMLSCARWGSPDRTLNLCSRDAGAGDPPLDPDQLLAVAETVR